MLTQLAVIRVGDGLQPLVGGPLPGHLQAPDEPGQPDEPGEPGLPQTGQLWWPVGLLAAAGAVLAALGLWSQKRYHGKHES